MVERTIFNDFRRLPVAALYEGGGRSGALPAAIRAIGRTKQLAGPAFPVKCVGGSNTPIHRAVYLARPGDVLVIASEWDTARALLGDLVAEAAIARGLAGIVVDGHVRDLEALEELDFPVFCRGGAVEGPLKGDFPGAGVGEAVRIGCTDIQPGDFLRGDADGVLAIAAGKVKKAVKVAITILETEEHIRTRVRNGEKLGEILGIEL